MPEREVLVVLLAVRLGPETGVRGGFISPLSSRRLCLVRGRRWLGGTGVWELKLWGGEMREGSVVWTEVLCVRDSQQGARG